jgi:hypothetical protein
LQNWLFQILTIWSALGAMSILAQAVAAAVIGLRAV